MRNVFQVTALFGFILFFCVPVAPLAVPSGVEKHARFPKLPRCAIENCSFSYTAALHLCSSSRPFPCASECSPESRSVIEMWFRRRCPEVIPVEFGTLSTCVRNGIVFSSLERGCYALTKECFCKVSPSDALQLVDGCTSLENAHATEWLSSLCGQNQVLGTAIDQNPMDEVRLREKITSRGALAARANNAKPVSTPTALPIVGASSIPTVPTATGIPRNSTSPAAPPKPVADPRHLISYWAFMCTVFFSSLGCFIGVVGYFEIMEHKRERVRREAKEGACANRNLDEELKSMEASGGHEAGV